MRAKTLLITGITRGIGRAFLPGLLTQGLNLVLVSRGLAEMLELREELGVDESRVRLFECDFSDAEAVERTAGEILRERLPLDGILLNAAIDRRLVPDVLLGLLCLLLSGAGGGISGQSITVDGGIVHPLANPGLQGGRLPAILE